MNNPFPFNDAIYMASDITAAVFLIMLTVSISLQTEKRNEPAHLLASAILMLAGINTRLLAGTIEILPDNFVWQPSAYIPPVVADVIWILSFLLIIIGIMESAAFVIYVNGGKNRSSLRVRFTASAVIFAAGSILYACTGSIIALTTATLSQFLFCFLHIYISCSGHVMCQFGRASFVALVMLAAAIFLNPLRMTGLGFPVMLLILNEQYHSYIGRELAENEAELAKGKVQLLAEQISPHYIYNSLQSIRSLCCSDPAKARDAIDSFSEFLRGNLESLTVEELIPFSRELELTQAYLELEKLTGRVNFEVKYDLETTEFMLPPLVLQPVVENAVKHGAYAAASGPDGKSASVTEITIATSKSGGYICIEVTDRTEGRDAAVTGAVLAGARDGSQGRTHESARNRNKRKSVGLDNVRTRLAIQSGGTLELWGYKPRRGREVPETSNHPLCGCAVKVKPIDSPFATMRVFKPQSRKESLWQTKVIALHIRNGCANTI